MADHDEYV